MAGYTIRGTMVTPFELISGGQVEVTDGTISYAGPRRAAAGHVIDHADDLVCPGFIDLHVHGGAGVDTMDPDPEALSRLSTYLATGGVTGFLATTHTAPKEELITALCRVEAAQRMGTPGAVILGAHVEGPFISEEKKGAQDGGQVRQATEMELDALYTASGGTLKIMTLSPETGDALRAVEWLVERGVVAAAGHTDASYEEALRAFDRGITHLSHFYNGMRGLHHREPGVVGAGLTDGRVNLELVADGVHVHPAALRLAVLAKGPAKIALVSDSVKPGGLPDGEYSFGGRAVHVKGRNITLRGGVIAGSGIRLNDAIATMVEEAGVALTEAVQMASNTPARILKLTPRKGRLEEGADADITVIDWRYRVLRTIVGGETVYEAEQQ
ncbi:MAG: N-acetylglucosamine-6-phosphate deacetylase [Candidatus Bathyarchaeota archaeon]